jgi:hypothetical protein
MTELIRTAAGGLAARIDRRRFLRKGATATFTTIAVAAAGGGLGFLRTSTARASHLCSSGGVCNDSGAGCPYGCGPSQCCNYSGRSSACHCANGTTCKNTTKCKGPHNGTWGGTAYCWTCYRCWNSCSTGCSCRTVVTCCDCETSGCGDSSGHCIGYTITTQKRCASGEIEVVQVIEG